MTAVDKQQDIPLHLRFSSMQKTASPIVPGALPKNALSKSRSIYDAFQSDVVFIQDMSQGLADTSWERQDIGSPWQSDNEEDSLNIEAKLQTARLCSTMKRLCVNSNDLSQISSPNSSVTSSFGRASPIASDGGQSVTSAKPAKVDNTVQSKLSFGNGQIQNRQSLNNSVAPDKRASPIASNGVLGSSSVKLVKAGNRSEPKSPSRGLLEFLRYADLQSWVDKLVEQEIDLDCIGDLSDADLIGLGMAKIGTRRKFQRMAREWLQQKKST